MFGHLKAADFMNRVEGAPLPDTLRAHLESCARCADTLRSIEHVRNQVTAMQMTENQHVPEPDWAEFRGDVRNALLSRSVKRETASRNWLGGMSWRPAAAWGFSLVLVFGMMTSVVMWNQDGIETSGPAATQVASPQESLDSFATIDAMAGMSQSDVFDDVLRLDERETESLRLLLEEMTPKGGKLQ